MSPPSRGRESAQGGVCGAVRRGDLPPSFPPSDPLGHALGSAADYAAVAVLIATGLYTLVGDDRDEEARIGRLLGVRGWAAALLGLTVSLDELAIGFTLGLWGLPIGPVVALIGVQALILSQVGLRLGSRLADRVREGAERLAGLVLVGLGSVVLLEALL